MEEEERLQFKAAICAVIESTRAEASAASVRATRAQFVAAQLAVANAAATRGGASAPLVFAAVHTLPADAARVMLAHELERLSNEVDAAEAAAASASKRLAKVRPDLRAAAEQAVASAGVGRNGGFAADELLP